MRSCVDFPDPSDHSTIMSVPGRSSVEKNGRTTSTILLLGAVSEIWILERLEEEDFWIGVDI
jgi:hypothetical protein